MINIQIADSIAAELSEAGVNEELLVSSAQAVLEKEGSQEGDLTILVTDDQQMQELNSAYRGLESSTDVLAFSAGYTDPDTSSPYLGDVIISYPKAVEQAAVGGHPITQELQLLTVHGVLHLLGYDDEEEEEKKRMWAAQSSILSRLDNPLSPP
jgi:probable rRNA maturation factor